MRHPGRGRGLGEARRTMSMDIERLAGHLDDARRHGREVERLTLRLPTWTSPRPTG